MKKGLNIAKFLLKISICGTNMKSSIDENINQINFVFIRNKTS